MKLSAHQEAIHKRTTQIATLQDEIKTIAAAEELVHGPRTGTIVPRGIRESEKSPRRSRPKAHQRFSNRTEIRPPTPVAAARGAGTSVGAKLDKPDTVVGAIKYLLKDEAVGASFTRELLTANLQVDTDFKRLYDADVERGEKSIENALRNWTFEKRLTKNGENYTVTAALKEWLGA